MTPSGGSGGAPERPVDRARRLVPPGTWLGSPVFEQAEEFAYDPNPPRTEDGWIAYAPIGSCDPPPAGTSRQSIDSETDRRESPA